MRSIAEADLNLSVRDRDDPLCVSDAVRGAMLQGIDSIAPSKTATRVGAVARPGQSESRDNSYLTIGPNVVFQRPAFGGPALAA